MAKTEDSIKLIVFTFDGDIYYNCTSCQARNIQRGSGGCIRSQTETHDDLRDSFVKTIRTFELREDEDVLMSNLEKVLKEI